MAMRLFRAEAIEHHRKRLLGDVIIVQPVRFTLITVLLTTIFFVCGSLLFFLTYSEREIVRGSLVPKASVHHITAKWPGLIDQLYVDNGTLVERGTPLMTIRKRSTDGFSMSADHSTDSSEEIRTIRSPWEGTITHLSARSGDSIAGDQTLVEIRGSDKFLFSEIVVPPRLIAFFKAGQPIDIHYDVINGLSERTYQGSIGQVSADLYLPGQWIGSIQLTEPAFKVSVLLEKQTISVGNQPMQLEPGMTLRAAVVGGKRRLLEVLFSSKTNQAMDTGVFSAARKDTPAF